MCCTPLYAINCEANRDKGPLTCGYSKRFYTQCKILYTIIYSATIHFIQIDAWIYPILWSCFMQSARKTTIMWLDLHKFMSFQHVLLYFIYYRLNELKEFIVQFMEICYYFFIFLVSMSFGTTETLQGFLCITKNIGINL